MKILKTIAVLSVLLLLSACSSTNEKGVTISKGIFANTPAQTGAQTNI